uniref:DNA polymerase III subunit alpha n=1 Tax=Eiseniibacteriota bacterium TaxID=2212470 RepID=A0A832I2Q3_UNCEI
MTPFTPLRVRSHGSLLWGTAPPAALVARALEQGCEALALADLDRACLALPFYRAALAEGLRPIPGATVTHAGREALLLPLDRRGWGALCAILTARHLDPAFDPVAAVAERHAGLHVIVETPELAAALRAAGVPPAAPDGAPGAGARPGGLWLGVRGVPAERRDLPRRIALARRLGVPPVATGDVAMLAPDDHEAHRVAVTAAAGELLDRMPASAFAPRAAWLAPPAEWDRRVRALGAATGLPEAAEEALAHNRALAARCRLAFDLDRPIFPRAPLPEGVAGAAHLARACLEGVARRYPPAARARARARLAEELAIIERMGFTDYFLLVAEIVRFARARGIPTVGRGSGAGAVVSYALGITNVDPLRHGLYFERFLHPQRRDCPDLDIDLCWQRRDEVIAHVYATYGHDRVAMISTHATLGARSAFRETAKALGVPNARVNALARRVPRHLDPPYRPALERLPEASRVDWREPVLDRALALAERLAGAPRHLSVHCGGLVIADRELTWYVPLERAAKGVVVTQFEMRAIEAVGLVKMDLLGNRALSTIGECVTLARWRGIAVDLDAIPHEDARTAARLAAGDTLNGFQLESPAMRHLLRMLRCRTLEETIAAVALVRPGAAESGMKEAFCRRHRGLEPATFHHERLRSVLGATHGCMLYEEDVMTVAAAVAGLPLAAGDDLRRALGKARGDEEFRALERGFVGHCARAGVDEAAARAVWRDLARFAAYAFCKAHAAGYGTLAWHSVWLKERFPAEWAVGVLNHHAGMYATWVHVEDLRRRGVAFLAPCVQRSAWQAALEEAADAGAAPAAPRDAAADGPPAVRVGLARVHGLAAATGQRILAGRPYGSLADFMDRARPTLPELEALILAGALDWTGRSRPSLLLEARLAASVARGAASRVPARRAAASAARRAPGLAGEDGAPLMPLAVSPVAVPALPEFDAAERVRGEARATGLWFTAHPLDVLAPPEALAGAVPAANLERHAGRVVAVAGLPCAARRVETRDGGLMLFVTLADRTGLVECVLFPDAYRRLGPTMRGEVVRAEGRVEETLGALTVSVARARGFGGADWIAEGDPSRNRPGAAA